MDDAFPGAELDILQNEGRFHVGMRQHGLLRPLAAGELSDGTLRFLLLAAALLTPRPPQLLVLNEPETSLHPDLIPALARLIASAAENGQVIVVTHNEILISALVEAKANHIRLEKELGETTIANLSRLERPPWQWPPR